MPSIFKPSLIDQYFDKIFYINLAKDTERNAHLLQQLNALGIRNYERVDAIHLEEMPEQYLYRNFIKNYPKYILGQLSCRASHLLCILTAKQRGYEKILILEDDVVFLRDPNMLLKMNYDILQSWDMLYFGGDVEQYFRNQIVRTHAYGLKRKIFDDIIWMAEASGMEIDNFYAKIIQHMSYNYNSSGKYDIKMIQPFNAIVPSEFFTTNIH